MSKQQPPVSPQFEPVVQANPKPVRENFNPSAGDVGWETLPPVESKTPYKLIQPKR